MIRWLAVALSAVCLFFAPALCAAGVLVHPCECPRELAECGDCCNAEEALACSCADTGCSHDGCANDPCGVSATAGVDGRTQLRASLAVVLPELTRLLRKTLLLPRETRWATVAAAPSWRNLPYPDADVPLRV